MNRIERVERMEKIFDEVSAAVDSLAAALDNYEAVRGKYSELMNYYSGGDWRSDYEADEAGDLPKDLKRGVLSQDGVYDLAAKNDELIGRMRELGANANA